MKDEMMYHGGHFGGKKTYMLLGTIAFVYGLMGYFVATYGWPQYMGWMVGGILLIVIGFVKKWIFMRMMK